MKDLEHLPAWFRASALSPLVAAMAVHGALGAPSATVRHPASLGTSFEEHLMWACDSAVQAVRLLLSGQFVGAAMVARTQLERWLIARARALNLCQGDGEATIDYVARVFASADDLSIAWDFDEVAGGSQVPREEPHAGEPRIGHSHLKMADGSEVCPGLIYGTLSEFLHGRAMREALTWESERGWLGRDTSDDVLYARGAVVDAVMLNLRQVRVELLAETRLAGRGGAQGLLEVPMDSFASAATVEESTENGGGGVRVRELVSPGIAALAPLTPREGLAANLVARLSSRSTDYECVMRGERPEGRLYRDDELATRFFEWSRFRSVAFSGAALAREARIKGEKFSLDSLDYRCEGWVVLSEIVSLAGLWTQNQPTSNALAVAASGVRSAYWLWLEDDDRAMAVLRVVLEQTARARAWRAKPDQASRLETSQKTTPRDWIEKSGWRRLRKLNEALGEFAHAKASSRWTGARNLLSALDLDENADDPELTARGATLDFVTTLLALEIVEHLNSMDQNLALTVRDVLRRYGLIPEGGLGGVERLLDKVWSVGDVEWGSPDLPTWTHPHVRTSAGGEGSGARGPADQ